MTLQNNKMSMVVVAMVVVMVRTMESGTVTMELRLVETATKKEIMNTKGSQMYFGKCVRKVGVHK